MIENNSPLHLNETLLLAMINWTIFTASSECRTPSRPAQVLQQVRWGRRFIKNCFRILFPWSVDPSIVPCVLPRPPLHRVPLQLLLLLNVSILASSLGLVAASHRNRLPPPSCYETELIFICAPTRSTTVSPRHQVLRADEIQERHRVKHHPRIGTPSL